MTSTSRLTAILAIVVMLLAPAVASAYDDGITGQYQAGCGGGCHGNASGTVTLSLTGPTSVKAGSTSDYTFLITHATNAYAGMNLAITASNGAVSGTMTPGNGSRASNNELTHVQPKAFENGSGRFPFQWTAPNAHGTYTFRGAGNAVNNNGANNGDFWNTFSQTITVSGATLSSPAAGASFCQGASITINWTQTGLTNLRIELSSNNFQSSTIVTNSVAASAGTFSYTIPTNQTPSLVYAIRLVDTRDESEVARTGVFAINGAPTITSQPQTTTVCKGRSTELIVGATGSGIIYRWRKNGTDVPGGTNATLRLTNVTENDEGSYDCVVTSCGSSVTSQAATVSITFPPAVTEHPKDADVCEGRTVELTMDATGSDLTFQWLKDGVPIIGATSKKYTIPSATFTNEGEYACRVTGSCSPQVVTDTARVNIINPPSVKTQPTGAALEVGQKLTLTVAAEGEQLAYQWMKGGVDIKDATSATYEITAVVLADSGSYTCKVKNRCDSVVSAIAKVTVKPKAGPGQFVLNITSLAIGDVPMCAVVDTTITATLSNTGGSPVTVTEATSSNPAFQIVEPTFPLTLDAGAGSSVRIRVAMSSGALNGTIEFKEAAGTKTMSVSANGISALEPDPTALAFDPEKPEEVLCITIGPIDCPTVQITDLALSGAGGAAFELQNAPALPYELSEGETLQVCLKATGTPAGTARLDVMSSAGNATVALTRGDVNSVFEGAAPIAGLTVSPNPMSDELYIATPTGEQVQARVYTSVGSLVSMFSGEGTVRWQGTDLGGARLAPGLYVLVITQNANTSIVKVLLN
jgi:hypothetical protein